MADRVIVFLDYQNVYRGARECFHLRAADHTCGQIWPIRLAEHLANDSPYDRALTQVRVYRGRPDADRDPKGYGACTRQTDIWQQDSRVRCFLRTLRYPSDWPASKPEEKGIDVALAIDFVALAVQGEYDVGILMSTDTDLKPALEFVPRFARGRPYPRAEVAAWSGTGMHNRRLSITGHKLWCHWLDETTYTKAKDTTSYVS